MDTPEHTIQHLFLATDEKIWETVEEVFNTTVHLDYSSMTGNPASELSPNQITSTWKKVLPGFEFTHHQIGNLQTTLSDNTAHVFCYGTATHYLTNESNNLWVVYGTYDFDLIKNQDGKWKITSMKFNYKFQNGNSSLPQLAMEKLK